MKNGLLTLVLVVFGMTAFAQGLTPGQKALNDGNEAFKAKDYKKAAGLYEKYFNSEVEGAKDDANTYSIYVKSLMNIANGSARAKDYSSALAQYAKYISKCNNANPVDKKVHYLMADANRKLKKYDEAIGLYEKSSEVGYKADVCTYYIAICYKSKGDISMMKEVLTAGLTTHVSSKYSKNMKKVLVTQLNKEAKIPFDKANELARAAQVGDPSSYLANMKSAITKYNEAKPLFDKVLEKDPSDKIANQCVGVINDNIKAYNDYKKQLEENNK